jgi:glutamine cyclotransferase
MLSKYKKKIKKTIQQAKHIFNKNQKNDGNKINKNNEKALSSSQTSKSISTSSPLTASITAVRSIVPEGFPVKNKNSVNCVNGHVRE